VAKSAALQHPVLHLQDVTYSTPAKRVLGQRITVTLDAGEILLITGPNGSGKSTLIDLILGRGTPDAGTVRLNVPVSDIGFLPQLQDNETHMPLSLRNVVGLALGRKASDEEIITIGLLEQDHLSLAWNSASGGEKRRTLLTRTFLQNPALIILDEPFNHLDISSRALIVSGLQQFLALQNKCVIVCTHESFGQDFPDTALRTVCL